MQETIEELSNKMAELQTSCEELRRHNEELISTQKTLEDERIKYRELFEFFPDGYIVTDSHGTIKQANLAAISLFNIEKAEIIGKHFIDFITEKDRSDFLSNLSKLDIHEKIIQWQLQIQPLNKPPFFTDTIVTCTRKDNKISLHWLIRDITKTKRSEQEIINGERKYRNIVDTILEGLWRVDSEGKTIFINNQLANMLGYSTDEILNKPFFDFVDQSFREQAYQFFERRKQGFKDSYDTCFNRKDGSTLWAKVSAIPIFNDEKHQFMGALGLLTDISDYKSTEQSLQRSINEWYTTFDAISDVICILDKDGRITKCNKSTLTKYFKRPIDELIGKTCEEICPDLKDMISSVYKTKKRQTHISEIDDEWYHSAIDPIFDDHRNFIGGVHIIRDITKYRKAQQKITDIKNCYESILEGMINGVLLTNKDDLIIYSNKNIERSLDLTPEEIKNVNILECCPEETVKPLKNYYYYSKKTLEPRYYDSELVTTIKGNKYYQSGWIIPLIKIKDKNKEFNGMICIFYDVTERKLFQDKIKEAEEKWKSYTENSNEYIFTTDLDVKIQFANRTFPGIKTKEQFIGTSFYSHIPEKLILYIKTILEKIIDTKNPNSFQIYYKDPEGCKYYFETHASPIIKDDFVTGLILSSIDITERKKVEDQLRESEERYRTIVEYSNDLIWTSDIDGNFTFCNKRAEKLVGYTLEELKGKKFTSFIIEEDQSKVIDIFHNVIIGQPREYETTVTNRYGKKITIAVNKAPIYSKGKIIGTSAFGRDITEQKKAEENLLKTTKELERSNKELEQFAYVASHDLQEPLRTISSLTELLAHRYKGKFDPDADKFINYIISGTKRMQEMINDLLALSRIGTKGKEFLPTNLEDVFEKVIANLHTLIVKNNASITIDKMPIIDADEYQLVQLFQNLIDNAIKFRKKDLCPEIYISSKKVVNEWIFSVKDNGIGIDPKNFYKLFVIFQRLHSREEYEGTGIGLALCKKIVTRHGGRIWIESKPGEGSTFYFSIPIRN